MRWRRPGLRALALALCLAGAAAANEPVERRVDYSGTDSGGFDRSYDLYRPAVVGAKGGGLVIFVHSRFWRERQPERLIEESLVPGLLEAGHSVAILRHRLLPEGRHPVAIRDAAKGVAALLDRVEAGAFDPNRVFLAGHSSGAQIALGLALDPAWLRAEGRRPDALAGVISISGILDLMPGAAGSPEEEAIYAEAFPDREARIAASPSRSRSTPHPAILLLTAARDVPGYRNAAVRAADALRGKGPSAAEAFIANGRDHFSILQLADPRNDARRHVFAFLDSDPRSGLLPEAWQIVATWRDPPYTTEDFHTAFPRLVEEFPADDRFHQIANRPFQSKPGDRRRLNVSRYQAVDLIGLIEALGPRVGTGDWLEIRNVRGEWTSFDMETLRQRRPRIVIGVDSERNLFRATDLYHTLRRYSWVDPEPRRVDMARPLGAFLYFPQDETRAYFEAGDRFGRYALTLDSFRLRSDDPLAPLADLSPLLRATLTASPACIACHQFRGIGGRALHIRAHDAKPMGGHALPLERYPAIVWQRFVFDQARVAEEVGATPIVFDPEVAQALYDLVVREREARNVGSWTNPERDRVED